MKSPKYVYIAVQKLNRVCSIALSAVKFSKQEFLNLKMKSNAKNILISQLLEFALYVENPFAKSAQLKLMAKFTAKKGTTSNIKRNGLSSTQPNTNMKLKC